MTLSDLAALGSFVSGIAVLISLIYVAMQIRQTERNQRTLLQQETSSRNIESIKHWADPAVAGAMLKVLGGDADLTEADIYALQIQLRLTLTSAQDSFLLHSLSMIDNIQFESGVRSIKNLLGYPVLRAIWNTSRQTYSPRFVEWFDAQIRDSPLNGPVDSVAGLKLALADLKTTGPK
jgi:hypothetical protein